MVRDLIILNVFLLLMTNISAIMNGIDSQKPQSIDIKYLNKCCPVGKYVGEDRACLKSNGTLSFSTIKIYNKELIDTKKALEEVFTLTPSKFEDEAFNEVFPVILMGYNIYVTESGELQLELPNRYDRWVLVTRDNYCVDHLTTVDPKETTPEIWAILPQGEFTDSNVYLTYVMLVSCFFMLLVMMVYLLLPELHTKNGMILMAYVTSLFMAFLLLVIIQLIDITKYSCIGLTLGIYFFFLATFCWMSVMSYDIWWTFRGYMKSRNTDRRGERFKFLMYCLYAWGVPLAMTIGLAVLNTIKDNMKHLPWFVTPRIPEDGCFLVGGVKLLYLYMPMLILIICNWMFYLMTAFNMWRLSRGSGVLNKAAAGNPQTHLSQRDRFMIYLKLSVVMGLNWLLEIISFLYPGFGTMWYITDAYNILIGLSLFLIFVCKKTIIKKLCKRYVRGKTIRWFPSSKSNNRSTTNSSQETSVLRSDVSSQPNGLNGYPLHSLTIHRID